MCELSMQASVTAGLPAPPASDTLGPLAQQPWGLPFALQRTSAFGDAAASTAGYDGRVVSPQPRYPGDGALGGGGGGGGVPDHSSLLWGSVKAAAAAAASRPQATSANVSAWELEFEAVLITIGQQADLSGLCRQV